MTKANIIIALGGRFHAQEMAEALLGAGHRVNIHTTFPRSRFPRLPQSILQSYTTPEVTYRVMRSIGLESAGALLKIRQFGSQLEKRLRNLPTRPDLFLVWSAFGLESLRAKVAPIQVVERDSTHISHQIRVLKAAYAELGHKFPDHSAIEDRELEEYELADYIVVLSEAAAKTFVENGVPRSKLFVQNGGTDLSRFTPRTGERTEGPLRVVYFGSISIRKGVHHLLEATKAFSKDQLWLTLVGDVDWQLKLLLTQNRSHFVHRPSMPHSELAEFLKTQDVFVCPSIEDGFGFVVPQAMASGVVPVVSKAAGASELITQGRNGFLIEPGNSQSIQDTLSNLVAMPHLLESVRKELLEGSVDLSWSKYSQNFTRWVNEITNKERSHAKIDSAHDREPHTRL